MSEFTSSSAEMPLVTRSAGLSTPGQWDHLSFEVNVWISLIRLEMKVFQREGTLLIQDRAIMESVQQMYSTSSGSLRASLTNFTKRALNRQPSNSRRGNVVCFRGATLDLAMTKDDTIELSQSSARKYTEAPYALGDASENAWSCRRRMASQRPGVYLLSILHDFNTSNPSIQRRKRIWYSGGTSSSHPSTRMGHYSIRVPGWVLKCLNLITAPGSVSNQPGSVTWLATAGISKIHAVSWRNHIENQTTKGAQNM